MVLAAQSGNDDLLRRCLNPATIRETFEYVSRLNVPKLESQLYYSMPLTDVLEPPVSVHCVRTGGMGWCSPPVGSPQASMLRAIAYQVLNGHVTVVRRICSMRVVLRSKLLPSLGQSHAASCSSTMTRWAWGKKR